MALNDIAISKIIKDIRTEDEKFAYYLYGVITQDINNKFYIFNFSDKKIDLFEIVGIDTVVDYSFISLDSIQSVKFSNWLFGMGRRIKIILKEGQKVVIKVNKFNIGVKKQKEHLVKIEEEYRKMGLVL
ncbi:PH domain-containing protein [Abyssisolibacter fermentans]|uniref:PH domain-containing protein n=1 Tax=Abyssisolibacter fermentans TaxID=1766203 RepID=UPI0008366504|nr:PH domain-containing protein [Abyssisolibacter fermentans]